MGMLEAADIRGRRDDPVDGRIATSDLEGTWVRTDRPSDGIAQAAVNTIDGRLQVRIAVAGDMGLADWGTAPVDAVYAASPEAGAAVAFTATYDRPFMKMFLHANLSKGLLIIASMSRFADGRRGEFAREFFRKLGGPVGPQ